MRDVVKTRKLTRMIAVVFFVAVFALCLSLCGCGSSSSSSKGTTIGSNSSGSTAIQVTNGTGKSITSIQYRNSENGAWSGNMITAGQSLADKAEATAYFQVGADAAANWDVQFTTSDGTVASALRIPLASVKSCTFGLDGNTGYIDYVDASGTKVDGKAHAQEVQKAIEAEAAEAAAAAEAEAAAAQSNVSSGSTDYSEDTSASQQKKGCL